MRFELLLDQVLDHLSQFLICLPPLVGFVMRFDVLKSSFFAPPRPDAERLTERAEPAFAAARNSEHHPPRARNSVDPNPTNHRARSRQAPFAPTAVALKSP